MVGHSLPISRKLLSLGTFTLILVLVMATLAGIRSLGGAAQESTPTHDMAGMEMPMGNVGLTSVVLARMSPPVAPDQELQLVRVDVATGATVSAHTHPGSIVLCIESGSPTFGVVQGTVTMTQEATVATPDAATDLTAGDEIVLQPGDCLTFDATQTVHTLYNPGAPAVIWQAHLYAAGAPPTTFLGTPAP
jgi:quercetin dioxygenase-like cupin family protein